MKLSMASTLCPNGIPFWNLNESWHNDRLDLPFCFQEITLNLIPSLFFCLILSFLILRIYQKRDQSYRDIIKSINRQRIESKESNDIFNISSTISNNNNNNSNNNLTKIENENVDNSDKDGNNDVFLRCFSLPISIVTLFKMICTTALVIINLIELIYCIVTLHPSQQPTSSNNSTFYADHNSNENVNDYPNGSHLFEYIVPIIKIIIFTLTGVIEYFNWRHCITPSIMLFLFWLLFTIQSMFNSYSMFYHFHHQRDDYSYYLYHNRNYVSIKFSGNVIVFLQFILSMLPDDKCFNSFNNSKSLSPKPSTSVLSCLTFWWFNPMIMPAYKQNLQLKHIWPKTLNNSARYISKCFNQIMKRKRTISSIIAKCRSFAWPSIIYIAFLKLITTFLPYTTSLVLIYFINYFQNSKINQSINGEPLWHAYVYISLMLIIPMIDSIINEHYLYRINLLTIQIRTSTINSIYKKIFYQSPESKTQFITTKLINLIDYDTAKINEFIIYVNDIWSIPLQIAFIVYLLWLQFEWYAFTSLGVIIVLLLINIYITFKMKTIQEMISYYKDKRIKLTNEILSNNRSIKLYCWERSFLNKLSGVRTLELQQISLNIIYQTALIFINNLAIFIMIGIILTFYILTNADHQLTAAKAFIILSLLNQLSYSFNIIPKLIIYFVNFIVSFRFVDRFLKNDEMINHSKSPKALNVQMNNATFTWHLNTYSRLLTSGDYLGKPTLINTRFNAPPGKLVAITGPIGSGKSSLLQAIMNNMYQIDGEVIINESIAYVSQQPFILNATIRDNIIFFNDIDEQWLKKLIEACALQQDIDQLPDGEFTEIGNNSCTLSNGQKQRIALARACYSNADLYLFDNPFSLIDAHVGRYIFNSVIGPNGILKGKTRILITDQLSILEACDIIYVMKDGTNVDKGSYKQLLTNKNDFIHSIESNQKNISKLLTIKPSIKNEQHNQQDTGKMDHNQLKRSTPSLNESNGIPEDLIHETLGYFDGFLSNTSSIDDDNNNTVRSRALSMTSDSIFTIDNIEPTLKKQFNADKEIKLDNNQNVSKKISSTNNDNNTIDPMKGYNYVLYFKQIGWLNLIIIIFLQILCLTSNILSSQWLSIWMENVEHCNGSNVKHKLFNPFQNIQIDNDDHQGTKHSNNFNLIIYLTIGLSEYFFMLAAIIILNISTYRCMKRLHDDMIDKVFDASVDFNTNSFKPIMNCFANDLNICDVTLNMDIIFFLFQSSRLMMTIIIIALEIPYVLIPVLILFFIAYFLQRLYISTFRQWKQWQSIINEFILEQIFETIKGANIIKAFNKVDRFVEEFNVNVDENNAITYATVVGDRWLALRLELMGCLIIVANVLYFFIEHLHNAMTNVSSFGLTLSYSMMMPRNLSNWINATNKMETNMLSLKCCLDCTSVRKEKTNHLLNNDNRTLPQDWPSKGKIEFINYSTRYHLELDLALKSVSFEIMPNEKVGVIGRDGAGKSTLMLALFRILEAHQGQILIDGLDISQMNLVDLRSCLSIIPQDPVLFTGTLRYNLDPFMEKDDEEIMALLENFNLLSFVQKLDMELSFEIGEDGNNLSTAQRQLICLIRSLLRNMKILVIDEAITAFDVETDQLIQQTIQNKFSNCTIINITHRVSTLINYDKIITIDEGRVMEIGSPRILLNNQNSIFWSMVNENSA